MKSINLKSLMNIYVANGKILEDEYINFLGMDYGLNIKKNELNPLVQLIQKLEIIDKNISFMEYNGFYLGYKIPQIGKEFDLLKITEKSVLNIEYKREIPTVDKIKNQLLRNKYYLQFLNKELILIGYIQNTDTLYLLEEDEVKEISKQEFIQILIDNSNGIETNLNNIFKASNYLISPFNKTTKFMEGQYFLTDHQEEIESDILDCIGKGEKNFLIQGDAGTGKTLLVYHIAKRLMQDNKDVAIIHCGQLNNGQNELIDKYNWRIYPIKYYAKIRDKDINVLILDEIQRIQIGQLMTIQNYTEKNDIILITSGDRKQILRNGEGGIIERLEELSMKKYVLTKKIRTNKDLGNFITAMLDLNKANNIILNKEKINITYFNTYEEANRYISSKKNFNFISYTPTLFPQNGLVGFEITCENKNTVGNPHKVIGQEFENVGVIIDKHFYYDRNNKLKAKMMCNNVYSPRDMFYQAVTRVIETLEIIVVDNIEIFNRIIKIFN